MCLNIKYSLDPLSDIFDQIRKEFNFGFVSYIIIFVSNVLWIGTGKLKNGYKGYMLVANMNGTPPIVIV